MRFIDIKAARKNKYDFIIVGTSFSALFFARGLRGKGHKILFVEKGPYISHGDQVKKRPNQPSDNIFQINHSDYEKEWTAHIMFGGNSNCWVACIPRFHPNDFKTKSLYGHGADWPVTYDDLETYYYDVEAVMEANGGGSDHVLPRGRPFPFPAHKPNQADLRLRTHSSMWFAQPTARSTGGRRAHCCSNGLCWLCPVDSKFTVLNSLDTFGIDPADCILDAECRRIATEGGAASGMIVRDTKTGEETELSCSNAVLGANAISNAAILLRSQIGGDHVGRGIVEQVARSLAFETDFPNYFGGTIITGHGYDLYDGAFRSEHAGTLIEVRNDVTRSSCSTKRGEWLNTVSFKIIAEDLPQAQNRVVLQNDEPLIHWHGHSAYALNGLEKAVDDLPGLLPFPVDPIGMTDYTSTEKHIQGGTVMSASVEAGVVDQAARLHTTPGVYVVGAGMFPTCPAANPTLTLSALSLRAGTLA